MGGDAVGGATECESTKWVREGRNRCRCMEMKRLGKQERNKQKLMANSCVLGWRCFVGRSEVRVK